MEAFCGAVDVPAAAVAMIGDSVKDLEMGRNAGGIPQLDDQFGGTVQGQKDSYRTRIRRLSAYFPSIFRWIPRLGHRFVANT